MALCDYEAAAGEYRRLSSAVAELAPVADDRRLTADERQVMGIVFASCVPYMAQGARAVEEAAERMRAQVGSRVGPAGPGTAPGRGRDLAYRFASEADGDPETGRDPETASDLPARAARCFEDAARTLYAWVLRLTDDAEALGDRGLTGDTHPYGDVVYGICIPYLVQASDIARRLSGGSAQPS